ncbi:DNA endonuclease [Phormidium sp. CCY1219]|uniref:DNA endonuclease n=1 Tax=Phormidium sp. CCY1219 TaxID=2886104 RepID=UPI002D1E78C0|nr:DNA endonuclease [Phormidium sp. CCY1219]MEB3829072.1 DNA endonuclease [Phormidium sp. CCY1219]
MDYDVSSKVEQRGVLAGMLLGKGRRRNHNFFIQHSSTQESYVLFKQQLLEQITRSPVKLQRRRTKQGYPLLRLEPKLIPLTRVLVKKLYRGGQPTISPQFLNLLTLQGIAIWFLDEGSKSFKKTDGKIHALEVYLNTYLPKSENEAIAAYFSQVWGIQWGLSKASRAYRLRMGTKESRRFFELIRPCVPEPMLYKINPSANGTATTYGHQTPPTVKE